MIEKYSMELDSKKHPVLIRENRYEYQDIKLDSPEKIVCMLNTCFHLSSM